MKIEVYEYHDDLRVVVVRAEDGSTTERPYTAEENAEVDAKAALKTNEQTLTTDANSAIASLEASIAALQGIKDKANTDITAIDTKNTAREARKVAQQVVRLSRLLLDKFDSTNVGPA